MGWLEVRTLHSSMLSDLFDIFIALQPVVGAINVCADDYWARVLISHNGVPITIGIATHNKYYLQL